MLTVAVQIDGFDEQGNPTEDMQAEIVDAIVTRITNAIESDIRKEISSKFTASVSARLDLLVQDFLDKPIQPTNSYGEKKGAQLTLTEYIVERGRDHLLQKVDSNGSPSNYGDKTLPRIDWLARKLAEETVLGNLKPELEKAKTTAKEFVATRVAAALKEAMSSAIK